MTIKTLIQIEKLEADIRQYNQNAHNLETLYGKDCRSAAVLREHVTFMETELLLLTQARSAA